MDETQGTEGGKKKSPLMLIVGVAALTSIGGGGGWFLGNMIAPAAPTDEHAATQGGAGAHGEGKEEGIPKIATEANGVVLLDPVTTNLAYPSDNWIRLEVALAFKGPPELPLAEEIHQDILAYMRTVSLQQIEGPRGFQYLRDDIQERVDLRSQGKVSKVLFRTMVIE
ncbi:flagellar FliL protein [Pseudorhizobium tarimense]|uniref:Flagellar protein FliL n=1 Tax=Pseudorhizobium tarimense TaxID=1079109 RepID=A0ABV2HBP9_9HYPH|nr:flagellar basal body-associated FliL family protein [Pseudorhizobium tarimense]MCJ8520854.1 flagellar basal body-associated FliL family protein [Pseudorhizobium tarimense]